MVSVMVYKFRIKTDFFQLNNLILLLLFYSYCYYYFEMDPITPVVIVWGIVGGIVTPITIWVFYKLHKIDQERYKLQDGLKKNREWYKPKDKDVEYSINPMFSVVYHSR
jgi:hypothetical protein